MITRENEYTSLVGTTRYNATIVDSTFITAGANVNGVLIKAATLTNISASASVAITVNGVDAFQIVGQGALFIHDIFVPAGQAVGARCVTNGIVNLYARTL